jgi:hypothetical protein
MRGGSAAGASGSHLPCSSGYAAGRAGHLDAAARRRIEGGSENSSQVWLSQRKGAAHALPPTLERSPALRQLPAFGATRISCLQAGLPAH